MKGVYAIPDESVQRVCHARHAPSGAVLMAEDRPTKFHVCLDQGDGTGLWVVSTALVENNEEQEAREIERTTGTLANVTMEQADAWLDNQGLDANVLKVIKKVVRLILSRT